MIQEEKKQEHNSPIGSIGPMGPIGLIGAMAMEVETLLSKLESPQEQEIAGIVFTQGKLSGVPCVVAQCGPGKVNAAVCGEIMMQRFTPRMLLNLGVAGGIGPQVKIGDIVLGTHCVQHDMDTTSAGDKKGEVFLRRGAESLGVVEFPCDPKAVEVLTRCGESLGMGVHTGPIATGDLFVADPVKCQEIGGAFSALACEMEGAAVAQVCFMHSIPCVVLRAISDNANDEAKVDFPTFARASAEKSARLLEQAIRQL